MKQLILVAIMLFALTTIKATAQGSGLSHPVRVSYTYYNWQQFDGAKGMYMTNQSTMNGLGYTPFVINDTDHSLQLCPTVFFQSDVITNLEADSARRDTAHGYYQLIDKWVAHGDTIMLYGSYYFTGQLLNLLSTKTGGDSTIIKPVSGNINGASTLIWDQARYGTYRKLSILYDGTNYWINR